MSYLVQSIWDIFNDQTLLEMHKTSSLYNQEASQLKKSDLGAFFRKVKEYSTNHLPATQPGSLIDLKLQQKMTQEDIENADYLADQIKMACSDSQQMTEEQIESIVTEFMDQF